MQAKFQVALARQVRVISALTIREIRLRNSKHAFMHLFDILETLVFIVAHFAIFKFLGRHLLVGDSLLLFITTGILPILFFKSLSIRTASAMESAKSVTSIPLIEALDYAMARCFTEFLSFTVAFVGFFAMLTMLGVSRYAAPFNPLGVIEFIFLLTIFSFGIGMINTFIAYIFPLWKYIWGGFSRIQIFSSGVFFIPEYMPPVLRNLLAYNPLLHFVALFRSSFYPTYPTHLLSLNYILGWTFSVVLIGLACERAQRVHRAE
jgi:capsular polysaccharide transport system permease protein